MTATSPAPPPARAALPAAAALAGIAIGLAAGWMTARRLLTVVTIDGHSMTPTLVPGDRLLIAPLWRRPRCGDLVAVRPPQPLPGGLPHRWVIKRVAAITGDPVPDPVARMHQDLAGCRVLPGQVVVLGDHPHSLDSKTWGPLPAGALAGVAVRRIGRARAGRPAPAEPPVIRTGAAAEGAGR